MKSLLVEQIIHLLLRHDYVVVPNFGGFLCEVLPAGYDAHRRMVYPPRAELHFNAEMSYGDGLLEERYALLLGISLRRARLALEEDVRELRQHLVKHRSCLLDGLGVLSLSEEGLLSFEPSASTRFAQVRAYGYTPLLLPLLSEASPRRGLQTLREGVTDDRYLAIRIPKRALSYAACLLLILLSLLPWGNQVNREEGYQAGFTPTPELAEQLLGRSAHVAVDDTASTEALPTTLRWSTEADGRFHVILASERQRERIQEHYDRLREELPEAQFVVLQLGNSRMLRLSVSSFGTASEAYAYLQKLVKDHPACGSAWVYTSK